MCGHQNIRDKLHPASICVAWTCLCHTVYKQIAVECGKAVMPILNILIECVECLFNFTLLSVCTCLVCQINAEFHPEPLEQCWACIDYENGKDIITRTETPRKRMRTKKDTEKKHGNSYTERKIMHSTVFFWQVHTLKGESNKWCYGKQCSVGCTRRRSAESVLQVGIAIECIHGRHEAHQWHSASIPNRTTMHLRPIPRPIIECIWKIPQ